LKSKVNNCSLEVSFQKLNVKETQKLRMHFEWVQLENTKHIEFNTLIIGGSGEKYTTRRI